MTHEYHPDLDVAVSTQMNSLPKPMWSREHIFHRDRSAWYVGFFFFGILSIVLLIFLFSGTDWYLWHDGYPGLRHIGYAHRIQNLNCEILIFGDSSSLTGLDPKIVSQRTGMTACNISEGFNIETVVGTDEVLQTYLAHNTPPRVLLTNWTPTIFLPDIPKMTTLLPEGVVYAAQYSEWKFLRPSLWLAVRKLPHVSSWLLKGYIDGILEELSGNIHHLPDTRAERAQRLGQWPYPLPPEAHCVRVPGTSMTSRKDMERSINNFRRKWSRAGTLLLVDVSPVPECERSFAQYRADLDGLTDNEFVSVPVRYFNEGDVHFSPEGSRYLSEQAAKQVLERLHPKDAATTTKDINH